jgi:hypothetical protein
METHSDYVEFVTLTLDLGRSQWPRGLKPGIDCARLPRAAVRARQTLSFVYALITVFVSSIEARQPRAAVDRRHKNVSTERAQHTENRSDLARQRQVRVRQCSFCRARQHGIDFTRQSNEHCLGRQPRAIDTRLKA